MTGPVVDNGALTDYTPRARIATTQGRIHEGSAVLPCKNVGA